MTVDSTEPLTPGQKTVKAYKKGKRSGRKMGGWVMIFGGGLVGTFCGIGSGMKEVITELLPSDDHEEDEEEAPAAPAAPPSGPAFLHQQSN